MDLTHSSILCLPANGFPPNCYNRLFQTLGWSSRIISPMVGEEWMTTPSKLTHWQELIDNLLLKLPHQSTPFDYAIGHSLGGTLLLKMALTHPDRFRRLIIMDPALFTPPMNYLAYFVKKLGLVHQFHPLIQRSKKRRSEFASLHEAYDRYRQKSIFKHVSDQQLTDIVSALFTETSSGSFRLTIPVDWEIQVYATFCSVDLSIWKQLHTLQIPLLCMVGQQSDSYFAQAAERLNRQDLVQVNYIPNGSHLFPFEYPDYVADVIQNWST